MGLTPDLLQSALALVSGVGVGFLLGLVGGGGSILAVPLMLYVVGLPDVHHAIGTSALAVAASALVNLAMHARKGTVKWRCASVFAAVGAAGAYLGSSLSKAVDGRYLLGLFAMLMIVVALMMLRRRKAAGDETVVLNYENLPPILLYGSLAGALSGFFGIGGGFLIVPGLMAATGMPILYAVGSSLLGVTAFGLTAAINYAVSGFVDWRLAVLFIVGGITGGFAGTRLAHQLAARRGFLSATLAGVILAVAAYMLVHTAMMF